MGTLRRSVIRDVLVGAALAIATFAVPATASAEGRCPRLPDTVEESIARDATQPGPLTRRFRPVYGVYAENAAACWGGAKLSVTGFVASPEGLGGVSSFSIEPAWLVSREYSLAASDTIDPDAGPVGPFLAIAVPPAQEAAFKARAGQWVRATGHFDDRMSKTCVVSETAPELGEVPSAAQAIAICRTSFVLTALETSATPLTDTAAISGGGRATGWASILALLAGALSFGLVLQRRPRSWRMPAATSPRRP